jgi:RNA polymerase-binding transcription factor DksA
MNPIESHNSPAALTGTSISRLLNRSSLGTEGATALRRSVDDGMFHRAMRGLPPPDTPSPRQPGYRTIVAVDMEASTRRTDAVKAELRSRVYGFLMDAFDQAGITELHLDRLGDRGDGVLALVRPVDEVPETRLLDAFVPALADRLAGYNAEGRSAVPPRRRLRLRMVLHAGEVHQDHRGPFGESLDIALRLLDAPTTKKALSGTDAPVAVVVSNDIYESIVRTGYGGVHVRDDAPVVRVRGSGRYHYGSILCVAPNDKFATARKRLTAMLADIERSIAILKGERPEGLMADVGPPASGIDNERIAAALESLERHRRSVDAALARLVDGTYGQCVTCGKALPEGRIEARPDAARCVPCQVEHDRSPQTHTR